MIILLAILLFSSVLSGQILLPESDVVQGWNKSEKTLIFQKENLFDYINGGAEIFHEFGLFKIIAKEVE